MRVPRKSKGQCEIYGKQVGPDNNFKKNNSCLTFLSVIQGEKDREGKEQKEKLLDE